MITRFKLSQLFSSYLVLKKKNLVLTQNSMQFYIHLINNFENSDKPALELFDGDGRISTIHE